MMTRFTAGVVLLGWAACAAYPLGLLLAATPADFAFLRTAFGGMGCGITEWNPPPVTPGQVQQLGWLLGLMGLVLAGLGVGLLRASWDQRGQLPREWATARRRVRGVWGRLGAGQRRGLVAGLVALLGVRLLLSLWLAPDDDACSYRLFVRQPLLLISSCYPIPNNHVLTNSISRLFYLGHPGFWWSMRLPVLLVGALGTGGWLLLLLLRTNFRVAVLAVGLFSCLQLSLFVAAEGRGYALLFALSGLGFDSVLTLSAPANSRRRRWQLPWLALAVLGPLGLYAVPTFGYFLFSVYSWLLSQWLLRRAWGLVAQAGLLLSGTLLATTLLYAPVLLVSGFEALGHNRYVRPALEAAAYWRSLPTELWVMEGRLATEKHVGGALALAVVVASAWLVWRHYRRAGRLTGASRLLLVALWCTTSPYLLMVAQQVRAPERTLLYKSQFFFLLVALVVDELPVGGGASWWRRHWPWLVLGGWLLLQLGLLYRFNESIRAYGAPAGLAATLPASAVTFAALFPSHVYPSTAHRRFH